MFFMRDLIVKTVTFKFYYLKIKYYTKNNDIISHFKKHFFIFL